MPNYVMIPREIIYNKELGDKRVIMFSYLCSRRALDDTVAFSISELCHWSRLKPNSREGKINQKYLELLNQFSKLNYFKTFPDFEKLLKTRYSSTDYYNVTLNIDKFDVQDNFALVYFNELETIIDFKLNLKNSELDLTRMSSAYILLVLSYLRVNMNRNLEYPQCCYRLYSSISEDIGLSERYISRIIEILEELKIIKHKEGARKRIDIDDSKYQFISAPKIFADYQRYIKSKSGQFIVDKNYNPDFEINEQIKLLSNFKY